MENFAWGNEMTYNESR